MVDMKEIIKKYKNVYSFFMHSVSTMPIAIAFAFIIWFVAHQKANETPASKAIIGWQHFWFAIFMFLVGYWFYMIWYVSKETYPDKSLEPYKFELCIHDKNECLDYLKNRIPLQKVDEKCFYVSFERPITIDFRIFVFLFDDNENCNDMEMADEYVKRITEMTGFKPVLRQYKQIGGHSQKAQLFVCDHIPAETINTAQNNLEYDITRGEPLLNCFIDLNEGVLYIPKLCTRNDISRKYYVYVYALQEIGKYLLDI